MLVLRTLIFIEFLMNHFCTKLILDCTKLLQYFETQNILWRIDPLLSSDSISNSRCYAIGE
jgi:hypothetical protein